MSHKKKKSSKGRRHVSVTSEGRRYVSVNSDRRDMTRMVQTRPGTWTPQPDSLDEKFPKDVRYDVMKGTTITPSGTIKESYVYKPKESLSIPCSHNSVKPVWTIGSGTIYAGSVQDFRDDLGLYKIDVLFTLCGMKVDNGLKFNDAARKLFPIAEYPSMFSEAPPTVEVDWADGGVPKVGWQFWADVVKFVATGKNVGVYCLGGHGRTGTFLAAIGHVSGVKSEDIVADLRKVYCARSVETTAQIRYLEGLGLKTKCEGSDSKIGGHLGGDFGKNWNGHGVSF